MKKRCVSILLLLALALSLLAGCAESPASLRAAEEAEKQRTLEEAVAAFAPPEPGEADTEAGRLLLDAWRAVTRAEPTGELSVSEDAAEQPLRLTTLDPEALLADLCAAMQAAQLDWVAAAASRSEVYDEDGEVLPALLEAALPGLLEELLKESDYALSRDASLRLVYGEGAWLCENRQQLDLWLLGPLSDPDELAQALLREAAAGLEYIPLHYTIAEDALCGPVPDPAGYGETDDPAVVEALLQRPEAQRLIGGQELVWNADIDFFPASLIRWYLDESILVLVWQEEEARAVGTFAEVFIADASQFRRKVSADKMFDMHFEKPSEMGARANAVLALGGDMYYHGRECGVVVYQRGIYRFETEKTDTCFVDTKGDLLFSYRGELTSEEEARQYIEDNDVLFSIVFGPVLIDEGVDVTPERYAWGQTRDEYARSVLAQMGERHYLSMNINHGSGRWYHLVTLRAAADAMVKRGAWKAYTMDGGQTATTVLGGRVINRVQFDRERHVSDILYFATALPEDER